MHRLMKLKCVSYLPSGCHYDLTKTWEKVLTLIPVIEMMKCHLEPFFKKNFIQPRDQLGFLTNQKVE